MLFMVYSCANQTFYKRDGAGIGNMTELVGTDRSKSPVSFDSSTDNSSVGTQTITAYSEIVADISNRYGIYERGVRLVLIDENYAAVYQKNMLEGYFPDPQAVRDGKKYAVISDSLSNVLFKSIHAVGNEIVAFDQRFTVTGVYRSNGSMLFSLLGDGFDRVFIPGKSIEDGTERVVDVLAVLKQEGQTLDAFENMLADVFNEKLSAYEIVDYSDAHTILNRWYNLILFVFVIYSLLCTFAFLIRYLKSFLKFIKSRQRNDYLPEILKAETKRIVLSFAVIFLGVSASIYVVSLMQFIFNLPERYIPEDNIFDFKFYFGQILAEIKEKNMSLNTSYSHLQYLFRNIAYFNASCSFLILLFMTAASSFYKLVSMGEVRSKSVLACIPAVLCAGSLAGLIAALALGLEIKVPVAAFGIIAFFYFARWMNEIYRRKEKEEYEPGT